jgi:Secretion system C-terminal sorting domain
LNGETLSLSTNTLQLGTGANQQDKTIFGGSMPIKLSNGYEGSLAFKLSAETACSAVAPRSEVHLNENLPVFVGKIYPNPVSTDDILLEVESFDQRMGEFNLLDITGKLVSTQKRMLEKGKNTLQLDVSALAEGMYFIMPSTNNGASTVSKFVRIKE